MTIYRCAYKYSPSRRGQCQPDVAELKFHESGSKAGTIMLNTGTANSSLVLTAVDFSVNAGGATPQNPAWKAVDGKLVYADYANGWDANLRARSPLSRYQKLSGYRVVVARTHDLPNHPINFFSGVTNRPSFGLPAPPCPATVRTVDVVEGEVH